MSSFALPVPQLTKNDFGLPAAAAAPSYAYTTYTPTWTTSGTAPAIGNAAVTAKYVKVGSSVHAYGAITFGSSSTFGTGTFMFSLPVAASANAVTGNVAGLGMIVDSSASAIGQVLVLLSSTTVFQLEYGATYLGTDTAATATAPWTWATSDRIHWNITYEAA